MGILTRNPRTLLVLLAVLGYAATAWRPYPVGSDLAFHVQSLRQWRLGQSPGPNWVAVPDPRDLSTLRQVWTVWWPPGVAFAFAPLAATPLPLGHALRLTAGLLFLAGCAGWWRLALRLGLSRPALSLAALMLLSYGPLIGGMAVLTAGDVLPFALVPWLWLWTCSALGVWDADRPASPVPLRRLLPLAFLLGGLYWVKYSGFLTGVGLIACLLLHALVTPGRSLARRLAVALPGALCFAVPVLALTWCNGAFGGTLNTVTQNAERSFFAPPDSPPALLLYLAGAPGLDLFQAEGWITHLTSFTAVSERAVRLLGGGDPEKARAVLGLPGTAVLLLALALARRRLPARVFRITCILAAVPLALLAALTAVVGFNFLVNSLRFSAAFLLPVQFLALEILVQEAQHPRLRRRTAAVTLGALFFALPLAYLAADFALHHAFAPARERPTAQRLSVSQLSSGDLRRLVAAIERAAPGPSDVVVLAVPDGAGTSFAAWLEMRRPSLPLGYFYGPLASSLGAAADLEGEVPFRTARPLRVALVVAKPLVDSGLLPRLQRRFPQAGPWREHPAPPDAAVRILSAELRPLPPAPASSTLPPSDAQIPSFRSILGVRAWTGRRSWSSSPAGPRSSAHT